MKHSKLPWTVERPLVGLHECWLVEAGKERVCALPLTDTGKANAALIAKACNNYERLVDICKAALYDLSAAEDALSRAGTDENPRRERALTPTEARLEQLISELEGGE